MLPAARRLRGSGAGDFEREVEEMKRLGMVIKLKPGSADVYRDYHAAVWPEVLRMIQECNIRNYSIYFKDDLLFSYFEYHGSDLKGDFAKMAAHTATQKWWAVMNPLQDPLATRKKGEWWAEMEEVFHLD
jgi:L-rhamnose mutarotase